MVKSYDKTWFKAQSEPSRDSALIVLEYVIATFKPESIVDLGCGIGSWLDAARQLGVSDITGIDGTYVDASQLMIPPEAFHACDLSRELPVIDRRFDLAMSLEVLEHLPADRAAPSIEWLCSHSDRVLFSAAIPKQGGRNHINEQWQSWWARHFADHGYEPYDIIRPKFWTNDNVQSWYRQNTFVYMRPETAGDLEPVSPAMMDIVHPTQFTRRAEKHERLLKRSLEGRVRSIRNLIRRLT